MKDVAALALMQGIPARRRAARYGFANWQFPPFNRWAFSNARRLLPTARVRQGLWSRRARLIARQASWANSRRCGPEATPVSRPTRRTRGLTFTDGFLVLHRGRLVYEYYSGALRDDATSI